MTNRGNLRSGFDPRLIAPQRVEARDHFEIPYL